MSIHTCLKITEICNIIFFSVCLLEIRYSKKFIITYKYKKEQKKTFLFQNCKIAYNKISDSGDLDEKNRNYSNPLNGYN